MQQYFAHLYTGIDTVKEIYESGIGYGWFHINQMHFLRCSDVDTTEFGSLSPLNYKFSYFYFHCTNHDKIASNDLNTF